MRISDWSSDVCSSDLLDLDYYLLNQPFTPSLKSSQINGESYKLVLDFSFPLFLRKERGRSEEHTSELQSLMRISYAVFCLTIKTLFSSSFSTNTYIIYFNELTSYSFFSFIIYT